DPDSIKMFVGQIPFSYGARECRELFEEYGPVFNVVVHRDIETMESKGCCFVTFFHRADALSALSALHNVKQLPGTAHPIQMMPATHKEKLLSAKRSLFVGQISIKMNEEDVKMMFNQFGRIEDCTVIRDAYGVSKGCAFITFDSQSSAEDAINAMHNSIAMEGCSSPLVVEFRQMSKHEGKDGNGSKQNEFLPSTTYSQLLQRNNLLELLLQNPQGMIGTGVGQNQGLIGSGIGQPNGLSMLGNALTLNPSLIAAKQKALLQDILQRQQLIDSLLQQQQQTAASAKYGLNEGLLSPLS
ncbi:hypothetical protein PMAYCL1PPCAC_01581, partial [Pristionchus mayeri]